MKRLAGAIAIFVGFAAFLSFPQAAQAQRPGAMVDSLVWSEQPNQAQALLDLDAGALDLYMFPLRTAGDIAAAKANPSLYTIDAAGPSYNLLANPVPVNQAYNPGGVNPFDKQPVREALNYLIDREFIAREIVPGQTPMYTSQPRADPEYAREAAFFSEVERKYAFNPIRAREMIFDALNGDPDYAFVDGHWKWRGNPVVLNVIFRTEDIRRNIGGYIAHQLESYGFIVDRIPYSSWFLTVCYSPPDAGFWHLYTEAWGSPGLVAWQDNNPHLFFNGGDRCNIWDWYSPEPELRDVATRLREGRYTDLNERQILFKRAMELGLAQGIRVWVTSGTPFAISKRVTGFVYDLAGGPWSFLTTRTARFATEGGTLNIGQRIYLLSAWNPWRGFEWIYDRLQLYAFADAATVPHPHTGAYMGIRADWDVTTGGSTGTLSVPSNAQTWDPSTMGFMPVPAGTTATSRVVLTLTLGQWHDDATFDMDDMLYETALVFRRAHATGDVHAVDERAADSTSILFTRVLKGIEVLSPDAVAFYIDYWHLDPSMIASIPNVAFPMVPWTAAELALSTVLDAGPCSVDEVTAETLGNWPLDLTKGDCLLAMDANVAGLVAARHRPPGFDATTLPDAEVDAEWHSLWAFRNRTGHYFSSNGPFWLSDIDINVSANTYRTTMQRDPRYPFAADRYDDLLEPKIPKIAFGPAPLVLIGRLATFTITSTLRGAPFDDVVMTWSLFDPATGSVRFEGSPSRVTEGTFEVVLTPGRTTTLSPGFYELRTVAVGVDAAVPVLASQAFIATQDVETIIANQNARIDELEDELDRATAEFTNTSAALQAQVNVASTSARIGIAVGAVGVIAGITGSALVARRKYR